MIQKFKIVLVSKNDSFQLSREDTSKITSENPNITFSYIENNNLPLAKVYNQFVDTYKNTNEIDWLIFMHADVSLNMNAMCEHIESVQDKYDVLGLCGCDKIQLSISPLNWFNGSRNFPNNRWGCVTHGELGNSMSFFSQHHPEITDKEVACIDGLCMILSKKAIDCIHFDEQFTFSHYDTDFSLDCVIKHHLKLGIIVRKDLQHWSVGKSILTKEFLESEKLFREKWKNYIS